MLVAIWGTPNDPKLALDSEGHKIRGGVIC
jgi:hypothetical protein